MSIGRASLRAVICLCVGLIATTATTVKTAAQTPALAIWADRQLGTISPYVYGANHGPWSLVALDMLPLAETSGITYLRFPGGNWGDDFDLTPDQIDMFMTFARRLHAEPSISARLKGSTPEVAARLVRYVNVEKQYSVRYWSIGNEPNLYKNYNVEQYNRDWRKFAEAMLTVDPTITLVGPDTSQYPPPQYIDPDSVKAHEWLRAFLKANGDLVKIVSVHRYPFPKSLNAAPTTIGELKDNAREWDVIIPALRKVVKETTGHDLPVAVTEINSHWNVVSEGEATPDSFYNAVWWADVLGRLIRQQVPIVAYFNLYTNSGLGTYGLLSRYDARPTYYVYQLYHQFGDQLLETESTDAEITISAARRRDSALTLMIVNPTLQPKTVSLDMSGFAPAGQAELWRLDPDHKAERIGMTGEIASGAVSLPAQSVSLYVCTASQAGSLMHRRTSPVLSTAAPSNTDSPYQDPVLPVEQRVADLLARMTLDEKIGQMTLVEKNSIAAPDVTTMAIGGLLSGGGGYPRPNTPQAWAEMVDGFQKYALQTRLGIPLIYGVDAVHGHGNLRGATVFPHNIGLGATLDPKLVEQIGRVTAQEMIATGIYWNYAPVSAVVQDIRWGRTYESFSENTQVVATLASGLIKGLQGDALGGPYSVLATPKHFIGDGGTKWGTSTTEGYKIDQGVTDVDEATLRAVHLPPYAAAVKAGAMSIMVSFSSWGGMKMHAQRYLLTDVLKGELAFKGFLVSDWQGIDQIPGDYYHDVVTSINAGLDMIMVPTDYHKFANTLRQAIDKGDIPIARIDDAVSRILRVKVMMGLFEHPFSDPTLLATVGSPQHRALAREAVSKSLVLLKNEANTLPLARNTPQIFVAGEAADDIGLQSGGWTIEWQGKPGNITSGMTLLQGIKQAVPSSAAVSYERLGRFQNVKDAQGNLLIADVAIAVVGEKPYAEGQGDAANLALSDADAALIARMRERSKKLVVILISGRPMIITEQLNAADAFVAAWLPGTEGEGVADVLFGDKPFTGKLPFTWPRSMDQIPFDLKHLPDTGPDAPLFPFGYGLETR
jgi:beta-glucosidase